MRVAAALACLLLGCADGASRHQARGIVRDVRPEWEQVVIEHGEIPGLMPAMTMNFDVPDAELLAGLEKEQQIEFTVEFDGRSYRVVEARVIGVASGGDAPGLAGLAARRESAPDFALIDQAGEPLSSDALRGRTLLVDFVYTSCPGPCPIQTSRQVRLQRRLPEALRERVHFVSISLDPATDTPEALRAYALARGADLSGWSFLTGDPETVARVVSGFGIGSLRQPDGEIEHMLATFLVDAEGRIAERYLGLETDLDAIARDVARVAR